MADNIEQENSPYVIRDEQTISEIKEKMDDLKKHMIDFNDGMKAIEGRFDEVRELLKNQETSLENIGNTSHITMPDDDGSLIFDENGDDSDDKSEDKSKSDIESNIVSENDVKKNVNSMEIVDVSVLNESSVSFNMSTNDSNVFDAMQTVDKTSEQETITKKDTIETEQTIQDGKPDEVNIQDLPIVMKNDEYESPDFYGFGSQDIRESSDQLCTSKIVTKMEHDDVTKTEHDDITENDEMDENREPSPKNNRRSVKFSIDDHNMDEDAFTKKDSINDQDPVNEHETKHKRCASQHFNNPSIIDAILGRDVEGGIDESKKMKNDHDSNGQTDKSKHQFYSMFNEMISRK